MSYLVFVVDLCSRLLIVDIFEEVLSILQMERVFYFRGITSG